MVDLRNPRKRNLPKRSLLQRNPPKRSLRRPSPPQPNLPKRSLPKQNRRRRSRLRQSHLRNRNPNRTPSPKRAGVTRVENQRNTILSKIMEEDI